MANYPNTITRIDYPTNGYQAPVKQMPTYTSTEYTPSIRRATEQAYSNVARLNPFKIIRFVLIFIVIIVSAIFAKSIFKWVMNLFGQQGSVMDFLTGGKSDPQDKLLKEQEMKEAKQELKDLSHPDLKLYSEYLTVKNVKKDRRLTIDDLYVDFHGWNMPFKVDSDWIKKINGLANLHQSEIRLLVRYWDYKYKSSVDGLSLYDFLKGEHQLSYSDFDNKDISPFLKKLEAYGLTKGCPKLKK